MKLHQAQRLESIAAHLDAKYIGNADLEVTGINEIHVVEPGDIAFVDHPKYYDKTLGSDATVVIIDKEVDCPEGKGLIIHPKPFDAFNTLTQHFVEQLPNLEPKVAISAHLSPNVILGRNVVIGEGCYLHPGVVIYDHCVIGNNVTIHANTVIGSDGFYFKNEPNHFEKLASVGRVVIEDDVEIGSGCTIDRGVTGDTVIGRGSKLDNQIHIGHDSKVGQYCLFAAQVGLAGCVIIEDRVTLWGQVGVASDVRIGEGSVVYAQSGVSRSIPAGETYFGSPAMDARLKMKEIKALSRLIRDE